MLRATKIRGKKLNDVPRNRGKTLISINIEFLFLSSSYEKEEDIIKEEEKKIYIKDEVSFSFIIELVIVLSTFNNLFLLPKKFL